MAKANQETENMAVENPLECPFPKRYPSQLVRDDAFFMTIAYNQAIEAWRRDEVPIGAVIEYGGDLIASAHNEVESTRDPTAHAEMLALTQAANALGDWRLTGATLFVTKEPCPMCSGASLMARLSRVVYAIPDVKTGCLGGVTDLNGIGSLNHHFAVTRGVLEADCLELLQTFFRQKRKSFPSTVDESKSIE